MPDWTKAKPADVERFQALAAGLDGVEVRRMFGYPAGFVGGNMAFGLYADRIMLRLPEDERTRLVAEGWQPFEPMPGRVMREYLTLPAEIAADHEAAKTWLQRSADYTRGLPAKAVKASARSGARRGAGLD